MFPIYFYEVVFLNALPWIPFIKMPPTFPHIMKRLFFSPIILYLSHTHVMIRMIIQITKMLILLQLIMLSMGMNMWKFPLQVNYNRRVLGAAREKDELRP